MIIKKIIFACISFMYCALCYSQDRQLEVARFEQLQNDMTARMSKVYDQSGKTCALIKIETNMTADERHELVFEAGAVGVQRIDQHDETGEVWIFVPDGSKFISIKHPSIANIDRYDYPEKVSSATTYKMFLRATGAVSVQRNEMYATMNISPKNASLYIDGEKVSHNNGVYNELLKKGTHTFRVELKDYQTQSGEFELTDHDYQHTATLKPLFRLLNINTYPEGGAKVIIQDQVLEHVTPIKGYLLRTHDDGTPLARKIRIDKKYYAHVDTLVRAESDGSTIDLDITMRSTRESRKTFIMADASLGGYHPAFGVMVGMSKANGGYVHLSTDFHSQETTLECNKEGQLTDGNYPYYKDQVTSTSKLSITAGYIRRLYMPKETIDRFALYGYIGAGYGNSNYAWQTVEDEWVKNTGYSASSIAAELGLIARFSHVAFSLGYQTIQFKHHEVSLGLGIFF